MRIHTNTIRAFREKLETGSRRDMYKTEDGGHGIKIDKRGRCMMLNEDNLCDLYIAAGGGIAV